jgi:hypothetical protein
MAMNVLSLRGKCKAGIPGEDARFSFGQLSSI